jgi:hypothetical protein
MWLHTWQMVPIFMLLVLLVVLLLLYLYKKR